MEKDERVFGVFFVVTENGFEKNVVNPKNAQKAQNKLLQEIDEKTNEGKKIPKNIKKELLKNFQNFLDEI